MTVALSDGSVFATRYRVLRRIAMGGMGAVYEVMHLETERRLALKVMLPHIVQSADMRERFRREARVAAHIESEHIVAVLDAGIDDPSGMPFLVMELLRGEELAKTLQRVGRLGPVEAVTFLHQASLALEKTHRSSIVHRDLKPENLFLTEREDGAPRVKVLDFGIAKLLAEGSTQDPGTRSLGTPLYMAPEQFRSGQPISPATDLYALGMIAYTMLTGHSYWAEEARDSSNVFMFAGAVMQGPREAPSLRAQRLGVALPPAFDAWFARATAVLPSDRWPGALALVNALADALGVPQPGSTFGSPSSLRISSAALIPPSASGALPAVSKTGGDEASTWIYSGSQPRLGASGAQAVTGGSVSGGLAGASSTGSAYGSATGALAAPPTSPTGKILAAIGAGVGIGAIGLAALFLIPGGTPKTTPGNGAASASAVPVATAAPTTSVEPAPSASVEPVASAEPSASAQVPSAATTAPPRPGGPSKAKPPAPPPPGKKTIYVRD